MIVFILSLFSSGHKLRISSLYQLLVGKRTTSVLIYGFTHELLFIHNSFPEYPLSCSLRLLNSNVNPNPNILKTYLT